MRRLEDDVLRSLRRIIRATDIHSRQLGKHTGLTTPQLVVLRAIEEAGTPTVSEIARAVSLSQATVTNILNRLEGQELLKRERSETDRRRVMVALTKAGTKLLVSAPEPLQERFSVQFQTLQSWEQYQLVASLERIAEMMDAEELDAAPLLATDEQLD